MKTSNLKFLSDQELKDIYNGVKEMRALALKELNVRGIFVKNKKFTKRLVKSGKSIELFLKDCGFNYFASLAKRG